MSWYQRRRNLFYNVSRSSRAVDNGDNVESSERRTNQRGRESTATHAGQRATAKLQADKAAQRIKQLERATQKLRRQLARA